MLMKKDEAPDGGFPARFYNLKLFIVVTPGHRHPTPPPHFQVGQK